MSLKSRFVFDKYFLTALVLIVLLGLFFLKVPVLNMRHVDGDAYSKLRNLDDKDCAVCI